MSAETLHARDDEALYNIGAVARMTGIPVATLRAWERRYGFPDSERTEGGHRIYSGREVERLAWVKRRIDAGLQAGRAVKALHHRGALDEPAAAMASSTGHEDALPRNGDQATLDSLQARFARAVLAHDTARADRVLGEVLAIVPLEDVILHVIRPTLAAIGEGWTRGDVSVATEHLGSNYIRQRLLAWLATGPGTRRSLPTVLACAPDDWHEIGLLMIGVLAARRGWPVYYLGAAVPLPDLADFVRETPVAAVVLVASTAETARHLLAWPDHLPEVASSGTPLVCFGGRGFASRPELVDAMAGRYLGDTIEAGVDALDAVLEQR